MAVLLLVVGCSALGVATGWLLVPAAADFLLKRAYRRTVTWWWDSYRAYQRYKSIHPHDNPSASASGEEGALGIWLTDAKRAVRAGSLTHERMQALVDAGICTETTCALRHEADQKERCSFVAQPWQRALCACACAIWGGALACIDLSGISLIALGVGALSMTVAVVCDLRARLLPLECCLALALAGGVFQVSVAGISGLVIGVLFGLFVCGGCLVINRLFGRSSGAPVGLGDVRCMAALSLVCGAATPMGLAVCYAGAAVVSGAGLLMRKLTVRDGIPMAPFLALWFVSGVGVLTSSSVV